MTIAVLMTCHNRRETTLQTLDGLRTAAVDVDYVVHLVDDGSRDGTGEAVERLYPEVKVHYGDGTLFWNGGMRAAWKAALPFAYEYYLLLNDDLDLLPGSLASLMTFQKQMESLHGPKLISIGKVVDPFSGVVTYGGYTCAPGLSRLRFKRVHDGQQCDTFNGNCVMIPAIAVADVGILSKHYTHASGDVDYGLRARRAGYVLLQSIEPVGKNSYNQAYHDKVSRLSWSNWRFVLLHPKGIPVREWLHFCRAHGGLMWPVNFLIRYLKILRLGA